MTAKARVQPEAYFITGRSDSGITAPRLDIRDFVWDTFSPTNRYREQWSLFVVAYLKIQYPDAPVPGWEEYTARGKINDVPIPAQWLNIGGIHGFPYKSWQADFKQRQPVPPDPDGPDPSPGQKDWGGYCSHKAVTFPSWHRPYVMLVEQAIGTVATDIAKAITEKATNPWDESWMHAARDLRFPFWDWTDLDVKFAGVPEILKQPMIHIWHPRGETCTVPNPLQAFYFRNVNVIDLDFQDYFVHWDRTYRNPTSALKSGPQPKENYVKFNSSFANYVDAFRGQVASSFTFPGKCPPNWEASKIYDEFSNTTRESIVKDSPFFTSPIEQPHNNVHNFSGGDGDMADNDYAGFDPLFFLHHANVDRLLAFWEYLYPDYWMGDGYTGKDGQKHHFTQPGGTWAEEKPDFEIDENFGLAPFSRKKDQYWTPKETRFLNASAKVKKYYTYPVIENLDVSAPHPTNPEELDEIRANIQRYFGLSPFGDLQRMKSSSLLFTQEPPPAPSGLTAIRGWRRFFIDIRLYPKAVQGSYILEVVAQKKSGEEVVVGHASLFERSPKTKCAACQVRREDPEFSVYGSIPISTTLVDQILSDNYEPTTEEEDIRHLLNKLSYKLKTPTHKVIGLYKPHLGTQNGINSGPIKKDFLYTAFAAHPAGDTDGPIQFYGYKNWFEVKPDSVPII